MTPSAVAKLNRCANCPILERDGDGRPCGRCWFYLPDGKTCPRHGDVSEAVKLYQNTKELTLEQIK